MGNLQKSHNPHMYWPIEIEFELFPAFSPKPVTRKRHNLPSQPVLDALGGG